MSVSTDTAKMFNPVAQNRALALCVVASLVLHAVVLLLPGLRPGAPAPAPTKILTATFSSRATPSEQAAADATRRRERETAAPKPELSPPADSSRPVLASPSAIAPRAPSAPAAATVPAAPPAPAEAVAPAASSSAGAAATGPSRPAEAQPAAASAAGTTRAGSDADSGTLDQYRLALIVAAKRYKRYPAQAMDKGWQGKVEVRLVIGANGAIQSSLVKASSGHEILDNQAMDMVKKAKPLTPIPAALRGREFTVDIPVIFDLQAG